MKNKILKDIGLKLLALVFAALLWLVVINIDDPIGTQTYRGIPVSVTNGDIVTNQGKVYQVVDDENAVSVTVKAKKSVLSKIKSKDIVATANMKEIEVASLIPISVTINGFEGDYEEAEATPKNLQVSIETSASNKFPITVSTNGTPRDGYILGEMKTNPETVTIGGPDSVINQINRVVAKVDVSGVYEDTTLDAEMVLYDANDNIIDQTLLETNLGDKAITVDVHLLNTKSLPLELDTSGIYPAQGYSLAGVTYEPKEIQVSGAPDILDELETFEIPASALELEDVARRTEKVIDIAPFLPEGVSLVDDTANNVAVTISVERSGTKVIDYPLLSIQVNNAPAGLKVGYGTTEDLELTFIGPRELLEDLVIDKKVSIDLKPYTKAGTYTVPVYVELPSGCALEKDVTVEVTLTGESESMEEGNGQ